MQEQKIVVFCLFFCAVGVVGGLRIEKQVGLPSLNDGSLPLQLPSPAADAVLTCEVEYGDALYLRAAQCGQSYVICQSGSVVDAGVCPAGTRFHVDQLACLDEDACGTAERRSVDRDPRQIKFLLLDLDEAWKPLRVARRQIKFRSVSGDGPIRRQIKFRSLPSPGESAILDDDPLADYDGAGGRRPRRQIKFRSLAERAVEPKKHEERRRQMISADDVNHPFQLPTTYWYRRR